MKIKNGKIGNINKKLLAGALALTFAATSLTACSEKSGKFDYSVNEQDVYEVSGTIEYDKLKKCCFLVIENSSYDTIEYYITYKAKINSRYTTIGYEYDNILNNQLVFNTRVDNSRTILSEQTLGDYLYATNNIKSAYTKEDVEEILEQMKQNYINKNNKQKVKE